MIVSPAYLHFLKEKKINFYTGVPDSVLKGFCSYLAQEAASSHICAPNEGAAIAIATGHHLATGETPLVYMQNSGLGNAINPLTSLTHPQVYAVPMLLLIGWRGEPSTQDEPQHQSMGAITEELLETLGIPFFIHPNNLEEAAPVIEEALQIAQKNACPVAFLVRKNTFSLEEKTPAPTSITPSNFSREEAIQSIISHIEPNACVIATTGFTSRELFALRELGEKNERSHQQDFLSVGSMGHASSIALGVAQAQAGRPVYCLDGDGSALMHLGALPMIAQQRPKNFTHILFCNQAHESVGGQLTSAPQVSFAKIARASGYQTAQKISTAEEFKKNLQALSIQPKPALLELQISCGTLPDLPRPTTTLLEMKNAFMQHLVN